MSALFDVLCSTTGLFVNPSGIIGTLRAEKHVKTTDDTVYAYIQHFEAAFLFECVRRYSIKGKTYLKTSAKYYPEDVGLRNTRINFRQNDIGFGIENVIYNELRVSGSFRKIAVVNRLFKAYANDNGILVISLEEFLLNENSLNL